MLTWWWLLWAWAGFAIGTLIRIGRTLSGPQVGHVAGCYPDPKHPGWWMDAPGCPHIPKAAGSTGASCNNCDGTGYLIILASATVEEVAAPWETRWDQNPYVDDCACGALGKDQS